MNGTQFFRVTVWEQGFNLATMLGLVPDRNSFPNLFEWYFTFDNENDATAFQSLLRVGNAWDWIPHGVSFWNCDPRN